MTCKCGHPVYEHRIVRYFLPEDRIEITYCEHGLLKPKQPCECPQYEPEWSDEVNGQTDDGLQTWINLGGYSDSR